ncbi:MAG: cold shock domain-containing protein [Gammaproteobacteria bacterium]
MSARETGIVKWFNNSKGYGFIQRDVGGDVFVHYRAVRGDGFRTLEEGMRVEFTVTEGQKGLQAEDVAVL